MQANAGHKSSLYLETEPLSKPQPHLVPSTYTEVNVISLGVLAASRILSRNKGRWTKDEHERFLCVAGQLGKNKESWKWISQVVVTTRSPAQVRTHAQKYFRKIGQGLPFPDEVRKSYVRT
ncbi:unnamed protein product [Ectocarpus sp. CCAP 1310/34]|nr:unnamed protein product [Ectocarpus sp. CCAP 1310/34]